MIRAFAAAAVAVSLVGTAVAGAPTKITGQYMEARTCDVYTGPCVANAEVGVAGKEAVMAWHVDKGTFNGVDLTGLSVAAAVRGQDTLGINGLLVVNPFPTKAVVFVDKKADAKQREALVQMAQAKSGKVLETVLDVQAVPIDFAVNPSDGRGTVIVGDVAKLQTRALSDHDNAHT